MHEKRCEFSWWEDDKVNWGALHYTFGTSGKNYDIVQNFILPLDEKTKNQLKIAERQNTALWVINFLLFNFGIFSYRQRVISKHLKLVLAYVSWANNRKFTAIVLTMKPLICKFWILIHNNDFSIGILFWYISVTFSKKIWWTFFKNNFFGLL